MSVFPPPADQAEAQTVSTVAERAGTPVKRLAGRLDGGLDFISDLAVVGLASWTLLYHLALGLGLTSNVLLAAWAITMPFVVWFLRRARSGGREAGGIASGEPWKLTLTGPMALISLVLAIAAVVLISSGVRALWWPGWGAAAGAVVIALYLFVRHNPNRSGTVPEPDSLVGSLIALACALGFGVFSVFTQRNDPDDVFYTNRATWVAQHGTIPTKDAIFTSQHLQALPGAGVPVASIETLQGAIAHLFHLAGGTATYLLTPPVGTFLAVWALWRLIRSWAPRRLALAFVAGLSYLLMAGTLGYNLGVFFLARMQQGKVIYVAMLIPILYLYLRRWMRRPDWPTGLMLLAAGGAATGLTTSSTFLVPLICATAFGPLILMRRYRVAFGAMLPAVYPTIAGVVVHFKYPSVSEVGRFWTAQDAFRNVLGGSAGYIVIGCLAVFATVWLARDWAAQAQVIGIAAVLLIVCAPAMFTIMDDFTGAHAVLWRTIWVVPMPAMVGLLVTVRLPDAWPRWAGLVPAVAVIALVFGTGYPLFGPMRNVQIHDAPTWRYTPRALAQARAIERLVPVGSGPVLGPPSTMRAIALTTTLIHGVDPLPGYTALLQEPAADHAARVLLEKIAFNTAPLPSAADTAAALRRLDVSMVCVNPSATSKLSLFQAAGYVSIGKVHYEICMKPSGQ